MLFLQKFIKKNKKSVEIISILLVSLLVYHRWIFGKNLLVHGDWVFFFRETLLSFKWTFLSLWVSNSTIGRVAVEIGLGPTYSMYSGLAHILPGDFSTFERIIHLWPIAFLTPYFSYTFLKNFTAKKSLAFVGMLVYSFNTYFLMLQTGQIPLMAAFLFFPLIFHFYKQALQKKNAWYIILTGLTLYLGSLYEPRAFYIMAWACLLYFIFFLIQERKALTVKKFIKIISTGLIPFGLVILLNLYWLIGLLKIKSLVSNTLLDRAIFGNEFLNLLYAITLYHPFWTGEKPAIFVVQDIPILFWILPIFAFLGWMVRRKKRDVMFFGILALLGILLTKQSGEPWKDLYQWLYSHIPGFSAFREASKFFPLIALSYSVLITSFLDWLAEKPKKKPSLWLALILIVSLHGMSIQPLITGDVETMFQGSAVPEEFRLVKDLTLSEPGYSRSLWIPQYSQWSIYTDNHPKLSLSELSLNQWQEFFPPQEDKKLLNLDHNPFFEKLLNLASIHYIFLAAPEQADKDSETIFTHYKYQLQRLPFLQESKSSSDKIIIYENRNFRPHIYTTKESETFENATTFFPAEYTAKAPFWYTFSLKNVKEKTYIHFTDSYHPDWKLFIGPFSWWKIWQHHALAESSHTENFIHLNTFLLDPEAIQDTKNVSYHKNTDGSLDVELTLFLEPQRYVFFTFGLSTLVLLFSLGYLLKIRLNGKHKP